ncbi:cell filamentation protein Fic [Lewinellaceae bacterium SD302]|nr:cell filamentation protein Fic [Lewinellaceae bacterium SD302]
MAYSPPYEVDGFLRNLLAQVARLVGQLEGLQILQTDLRLRRENKIKSLHSSLAIEGNSLSLEQVTDVINEKTVWGPAKDILEVKNAIQVYDAMGRFTAGNEDDLLEAHGMLMTGLIAEAGRYRNSAVGVIDGEKVIHIAPPANRVPVLMGHLFDYLNEAEEDTIIKSCVFHYEFEFIHPFSDGNGRMGRLWQTIILKELYPILQYLPLENIIHRRQQAYYDALRHSQSVGNSNPFIAYALESLKIALEEQLETKNIQVTPHDRLNAYQGHIGAASFSRSDYQKFYKTIAPATATRDLRMGVDERLLKKTGSLRTTRYHFFRSNI